MFLFRELFRFFRVSVFFLMGALVEHGFFRVSVFFLTVGLGWNMVPWTFGGFKVRGGGKGLFLRSSRGLAAFSRWRIPGGDA
jgi:hypothetical protein